MNSAFFSILSSCYAVLCFFYDILLSPFFSKIKLIPSERIVVITGSDSGFGFLLTQELSKKGFVVVSACLTQEGVNKASEFTQYSTICDVTKESDVLNLQKYTQQIIKENPEFKIWAVVNNAGIGPSGFVDWMPLDIAHRAMDVNYFGLISVTRAFLPMMKKSKGSRFINISSMAGLFGLPGGAYYCGSKHAVEGFTKCLRFELQGWNIHVCNINPGFMKTPMVENIKNDARRRYEAADDEIKEQYSYHCIEILESLVEALKEDPMIVVRNIIENIYLETPYWNVALGYQGFFTEWMKAFIPRFISQRMDAMNFQKLGITPYPSVVERIQSQP